MSVLTIAGSHILYPYLMSVHVVSMGLLEFTLFSVILYPYLCVQAIAGSSAVVSVSLLRETDEDAEADMDTVGKVVCPRYPFEKFEGLWVVLGNVSTNSLYAIKRISLQKRAKVTWAFPPLE